MKKKVYLNVIQLSNLKIGIVSNVILHKFVRCPSNSKLNTKITFKKQKKNV